jgi:quercetin dioxygenase-like cupin family protein
MDNPIDSLPWYPVKPGFSTKLLHGGTDEDTRVQLLRLSPGTVIERHRHEGEVHAWNLRGSRKLLDTGEIIGPGGYVYEPPGNIDSWMAVGEEECIVFVTVRGAIDTFGANGDVAVRNSTASVTESYRRFLEAQAPRAPGE